MCSDAALDSHRFMDILHAKIEAEEVKEYKAFRSWATATAAKKRAKEPLKQIAEKEKTSDDEQALVNAIRSVHV